MRKISHSEISTYLDCQKKWELIYIKGLKQAGPDFQFGEMGHKVLETRVIPDEALYPELKEHFEIPSWKDYFTDIFEELDDFFKDYEILHREYPIETDDIKGVIDVVARHKTSGKTVIIDYKFSKQKKTDEDVLLDEQMYIYAVVYASQNGLTLDDVAMCYISIPKNNFSKPRVLKTGQLSKDKAQNTTVKKYEQAIEELGLNRADYEDFLSEIAGKTVLTIAKSYINHDMLMRIMTNIDNVRKDMDKGYVLEKCSFMCKKCPFVEYCKYDKQIER